MSFSTGKTIHGRAPKQVRASRARVAPASQLSRLGHAALLTALALSALSVWSFAFAPSMAPFLPAEAATLLQSPWFAACVCLLFPVSVVASIAGRPTS